VSTEDLDRQIHELRESLGQMQARLDRTDMMSNENAREIGSLNTKIDGIRDDLKDIKNLNSSYVQRPEIESRLQAMKERVDSVDASVKTLQVQVSQGFTDVRKDQQHILMVLYGTLITLLLSGFGMAMSALTK
jgi:chromosome segregation ATPase